LEQQITPIEGGLYVTTSEKPFHILKVLKFEDDIVHIALYKNRFDEIPAKVDGSSLLFGTINDKDGFGIGHLPLSYDEFVGWKPQFLQHSLVLPDELDGYQMWKESGGGVWR
jgi:hypothetical protein